MRFVRSGSGPPLLLLHGGLFNIDLQFGELIPGLAAGRHLERRRLRRQARQMPPEPERAGHRLVGQVGDPTLERPPLAGQQVERLQPPAPLGVDTVLGEGPPHLFIVDLPTAPKLAALRHPDGLAALQRAARALLAEVEPDLLGGARPNGGRRAGGGRDGRWWVPGIAQRVCDAGVRAGIRMWLAPRAAATAREETPRRAAPGAPGR